jgi:Tol biopolymer transport system component
MLPQPGRTPGEDHRLETWKEIAAYLNRDLRTVKRWEHSRGLPVHRLPGGSKASVYALSGELEAWRQSATSPIVEEAQGAETTTKRHGIWWAAGSVALLAFAALVLWLVLPVGPTPVPRVTRLTSFRGVEWFPAFSPDGKQVAFSWNGEQEDNYDIYAKLVDLGNPLRLTSDPDMDLAPVWSADGRQIAFLRWWLGAPKYQYMSVPALGGAEHRLAQGSITPNAIGIPLPAIAWTPDSRWLIIAEAPVPEGPNALKLVSPETSEARWLTAPPANSPGDCCPVVSPDGRTLAFLRATPGRQQTPILLPIAPNGEPSGALRPLEFPSCRNPLWSGGGSELLCVVGDGEDRALWRIPVSNSRIPQRLPSIGPLGGHFAIAPRGDRLVYSNFSWDDDIWQLNVAERKAPVRLIASTGNDLAPQFSPDGRRIAFLSNRSGHLAVWASNRDGANASELAPAAAAHVPQWSPNGEQIAYTCRSGSAQEDICVIDAEGGTPRQLTRDPTREILPSWSRDGRWLYFASDRSGTFQTWKAPMDASAPATQITKGGGYGGVESLDGAFLYYSRSPLSGAIWRVPVDGGEETPAGAGARSLRLPQNFALGRHGIFFAAPSDVAQQFELRFLSFSTRRAETVTRIEYGLGNGMSISPDGTWLLFTTFELRSGDLFMVENFR